MLTPPPGMPPIKTCLIDDMLAQLPHGSSPEQLGRIFQAGRAAQRRDILAKFDRHHKVGAQEIAASTQLFTPDWLCSYLVENALGRIFPEARGEYYCAQDDSYVVMRPEDCRLCDPACGCGQLLAAAYDVFVRIYRARGYAEQLIPELIIKNNLFGADIDREALLVAQQILQLKSGQTTAHLKFLDQALIGALEPHLWAGEFDVILANPPYLGKRKMCTQQARWAATHYPLSQDNLCTMFMEAALGMLRDGGLMSMLTPKSWLALKRFEGLRKRLNERATPCTFLDVGSGAFDGVSGEVASVVAFVYQLGAGRAKSFLWQERGQEPQVISALSALPSNIISPMQDAHSLKLYAPLSEQVKIKQGLATGDNARFVRYWWEVPRHEIARSCLTREQALASGARWFPYNKGGGSCAWYGMQLYVVDWSHDGRDIQSLRDAGGRLRSRPQNKDFYFLPSLSCSKIGTSAPSFRYHPAGSIFDMASISLFADDETLQMSLLSFLNSTTAAYLLRILSPTINLEVGQLATLPFGGADATCHKLARRLVELAKNEWDSQELSMDFEQHPLWSFKSHDWYEAMDMWREQRYEAFQEKKKLTLLNDAFWQHAFSLNLPERKLQGDFHLNLAQDYCSIFSYLYGVQQGRFGDLEAQPLYTSIEAQFGVPGVKAFEREFEKNVRKKVPLYLGQQFADEHFKLYKKAPCYQF